MFARWGRFVYRFRWATLIASAMLLGLSIAAVLTGASLAGNGGFGANLAAGTAAKLITSEISAQGSSSGSSFELIYSSPTLTANDPAFQTALENSVASLYFDSRVSAVRTPYYVPAIQSSAFISRDKHEALVVVELKDASPTAQNYIDQVTGEVHPGPLAMVVTGQVPINLAFNKTLENDLQQAEYIALPITLLLLVLIFAAFIAALLPLSVGVLAIVGGLGGTLFLAHFTDVSQYAINIVTLIGLGVAIDYSLFIVNRPRRAIRRTTREQLSRSPFRQPVGRSLSAPSRSGSPQCCSGHVPRLDGRRWSDRGRDRGLYGLTFLPALSPSWVAP
jgi:RND superfamily putative drug exporter